MTGLIASMAVVWLVSMIWVGYWLGAEKVRISYDDGPFRLPNVREAFGMLMLSPAVIVWYCYATAVKR